MQLAREEDDGGGVAQNNFKKKPCEVGDKIVLDNFKKQWETNQLLNQRFFF